MARSNRWEVCYTELERIAVKRPLFPCPATALVDVIRTMKDWFRVEPKETAEIPSGVMVRFVNDARVEMVARPDGLHLDYFEPETEIADEPVVIEAKGA